MKLRYLDNLFGACDIYRKLAEELHIGDNEMKLLPGFKLGVILGLALGLLASVCAMQYFHEKVFSKYSQDFIDNMVPALFAVMATFVASIFAIVGVYISIDNQNHIENRRTENRLIAYRASLPIALSELVRICKLHVQSIKRGVEYGSRESMVISDATRDTIQEVIQNSNDVIKHDLSKLMAYYQFAESKYNSLADNSKALSGGNKLTPEEAHLIMLWVSLKTLTESYYQYGRGEEYKKDLVEDCKNFREDLKENTREYQRVLFSKYLNSYSIEDCGFLDPNYLKKERLNT